MCCARHGDDGLADTEALCDFGHLVERPQHLHVLDRPALFARIIVQQRNDAPEPARGQVVQKSRGGRARSKHDHRIGFRTAHEAEQAPLLRGPIQQAAAAHHGDEKQRRYEENRPRHGAGRRDQQAERGYRERGERGRGENPLQIEHVGVAP